MGNKVKKYIILSFSILIPLLVTFLIASYGYNSEKFGQGAWKNEYRNEYLKFPPSATTEEQIEKNLKYGINNLYHLYDKDPVFSELIKSGEINLFQLDIYRTIYETTVKNDDGNMVKENRVQYLFLIYDVQYQNIRNLFVDDPGAGTDLEKEINEANVPTFSIELTEILEEDPEDEETKPKTKTVSISEISRIFDQGADYDTVKGEILERDEKTGEIKKEDGTGRLLVVVLGTVKMDDLEWSKETEITIKATVAEVTDPENEEGKAISTELAKLELNLDPEAGDVSGLEESYQQDLERTGYLGWVIKKYLWWISLVAFLGTGLITFSFYAVYLAEEQEAASKKRKVRIKR